MAHKVPFIAAELGADADPFMLHIYAALAEKERALISERRGPRPSAEEVTGRTVGQSHQLVRNAGQGWRGGS